MWIAAIGLQIAADERQYLVARPQDAAADGDLGRRVGLQAVGVDAVVDDRDAVLEVGRKSLRLPTGRRQGGVCGVHRQQQRRLQGGGDDVAGKAGMLDFRVEIGIKAARMIEEFGVQHELGVRPHVLEIERLAPTEMTDDDVGQVALGT